MSKHIKVMIVDDSALVRQVVSQAISREPEIKVIATAQDPVFAMEKMKNNWPDVLIVDIEMPRMDGLTFLKKVMAEHPTPVIICSSLAERGAQVTMEALAAGAVTIITKPKAGLKSFLEDSANDIITAIKAAARANMGVLRRLTEARTTEIRPKLSADAVLPGAHRGANMYGTTDRLVAIGTSTGGTQALEVVLKSLPPTCAGIVIVQHMPEKFTALFAERLNNICQLEVREAKGNDRVRPGIALIAPGGRHMTVKRSGAQYYVDVKDGPLVNRHKPSVDVLFRSVAQVAGKNALGIIMTGMGDDGARGLREMRDSGATTIAEDESTCVVFGMPKVAIEMGGASKVVPLHHIVDEIITYSGNDCASRS